MQKFKVLKGGKEQLVSWINTYKGFSTTFKIADGINSIKFEIKDIDPLINIVRLEFIVNKASHSQ